MRTEISDRAYERYIDPVDIDADPITIMNNTYAIGKIWPAWKAVPWLYIQKWLFLIKIKLSAHTFDGKGEPLLQIRLPFTISKSTDGWEVCGRYGTGRVPGNYIKVKAL